VQYPGATTRRRCIRREAVVTEHRAAAAPDIGLAGWDTTACPECGALAEIVDRTALPSTDGWIEHVKLRCVARHWFVMPTVC
jgi:hypothetical protein